MDSLAMKLGLNSGAAMLGLKTGATGFNWFAHGGMTGAAALVEGCHGFPNTNGLAFGLSESR
jgi:hypothetical protein